MQMQSHKCTLVFMTGNKSGRRSISCCEGPAFDPGIIVFYLDISSWKLTNPLIALRCQMTFVFSTVFKKVFLFQLFLQFSYFLTTGLFPSLITEDGRSMTAFYHYSVNHPSGLQRNTFSKCAANYVISFEVQDGFIGQIILKL